MRVDGIRRRGEGRRKMRVDGLQPLVRQLAARNVLPKEVGADARCMRWRRRV